MSGSRLRGVLLSACFLISILALRNIGRGVKPPECSTPDRNRWYRI